MSVQLKFVWIGRLRQDFWKKAFNHYWKKVLKYSPAKEFCLKDLPGRLSSKERISLEGREIEKNIDRKDILISLDQRGQGLSSEALAQKLRNWQQAPGSTPCFVVGGAHGLDPAILKKSEHILSLAPGTLPHDLARIILLEQIFRSFTIIHNHPYHN